MRTIDQQKPQKHIFVCVNERDPGRDACKNVGGETVYLKLKEFVRTQGLVGTVWITRARCLGFCNPVGASIVIYPEGSWFTEVTEHDLPQVYQQILS